MNTRQAIRDGVPKWLFKVLGPWILGSLIGFILFPIVNEALRVFPSESQVPFSLAVGAFFQAIYLLLKNTILNKMVLALAAGLAAYTATENPIIGAGVAGVLIVGLVILSFFRKPETEPQKQVAQPQQSQPQQHEEQEGDAVAVTTTVGIPKKPRNGAISTEDLLKIADQFQDEDLGDMAIEELQRRVMATQPPPQIQDAPAKKAKALGNKIRRC